MKKKLTSLFITLCTLMILVFPIKANADSIDDVGFNDIRSRMLPITYDVCKELDTRYNPDPINKYNTSDDLQLWNVDNYNNTGKPIVDFVLIYKSSGKIGMLRNNNTYMPGESFKVQYLSLDNGYIDTLMFYYQESNGDGTYTSKWIFPKEDKYLKIETDKCTK